MEEDVLGCVGTEMLHDLNTFHGERCLDLCGVQTREHSLPGERALMLRAAEQLFAAPEDTNKSMPMQKASIRALQ